MVKVIREFRDEYYFLSNFYPCEVTIDGITYQNSEAAFHSFKNDRLSYKQKIATMNPSEAKRYGRTTTLRPDWNEVRDDVMYKVVRAKFEQNDYLLDWLLSTGDAYLEEGNTWGDYYWGFCNGRGYNKLGKILMKVRQELKDEYGK